MADLRKRLAHALDEAGKALDAFNEVKDDVEEAIGELVEMDVLSEEQADEWDDLNDRFEDLWGDFNAFWLEHADKVRHEESR